MTGAGASTAGPLLATGKAMSILFLGGATIDRAPWDIPLEAAPVYPSLQSARTAPEEPLTLSIAPSKSQALMES